MKLFNCALSLNAAMLLVLPQTIMAEPISNPTAPMLVAQSQYDTDLLALTNNERAQAGLPPLRYSPALGQAAQLHAEDMVDNNFFSHTGSDGSSVGSRARANGYAYSYVGENIAAGSPNPAGALEQWMNSPGHRGNILKPEYTEIGFGYVSDPSSPYGHYWVQVFGNAQ